MVCYNWEVKFQGQHKLISWFPKININKDNKDNIIIYAWFKNILKGLRIRTFHGLKKGFFFFRERVRGEFGGHPPPGKLFFKNYIIKYPQKCTPCKHRYQSDPLHPDFFLFVHEMQWCWTNCSEHAFLFYLFSLICVTTNKQLFRESLSIWAWN